jgi:hypothetical protein
MRNLLLSALIPIVTAVPILSANAATINAQQQAALDRVLSQTTFRTSQPTADDVTYSSDARIPQIPDFSWQKGQPLSQAFPAALAMLMGADKYSPQTATEAANGDSTALQNAKLSELKFLGKIPFKDVISANPQLANLQVGTVLPGWSEVNSNSTLQAIANSSTGKLPIPASVLESSAVKDLPGIVNTTYAQYPGISKVIEDLPGIGVKVADLPGVQDIPWNKLLSIQNIPDTLQPMKFDKLLSGQEKLNVNTGSNIASGSNKEPHAPCTGTCNAVELRSTSDPQNSSNPLNGALAITGQKLKGGEGLVGDLMTAAGVREPAGFEVPYIGINGCGSKWSAESPNAQKGSVSQQLNLRFCYSVPLLGLQASPYFIPLPLPLPANEQEANLLLPMKVSLIAIKPSLPSIAPSQSPTNSPSVAGLPSLTSPSPGNSQQPFTSPGATGFDRVALFGSATKKAFSPVLGISSSDV